MSLVIFTSVGIFCVALAVIVRGAPKRTLPPPQIVSAPAELLIRGRHFGSDDAEFALVEFGDYECPPCRAQSGNVFAMVQKHKEKVRFFFKNLPLDFHKDAEQAALLAESQTNSIGYWKMHKQLMQSVDLKELLRQSKPAPETLATAKRILEEDARLVKLLDVQKTPSFYLCTPSRQVYKLGGLQQVEEFLTKTWQASDRR